MYIATASSLKLILLGRLIHTVDAAKEKPYVLMSIVTALSEQKMIEAASEYCLCKCMCLVRNWAYDL